MVFADGHEATFPSQIEVGERSGSNVRFKLEAKAQSVEIRGQRVQMLTYNDSFPDPTLRMREGDTVLVEFKNSLSVETNLHFHGLHVSMTQAKSETPFRRAAPGETILYEFSISSDSVGTHWYHPHAHGLVAPQLFSGMAGAIIVEGALDENFAGLHEKLIVLKDVEFRADGQIPEHTMMDWMLGREGSFLTVNGVELPQLELSVGVMRLRLINAANARYFRLALPEAKMTVISTDGSYVAKPFTVTELLMAPGERYDVIVQFKLAGLFYLNALPYNRAPEDMMMGNSEETSTKTDEMSMRGMNMGDSGKSDQDKTAKAIPGHDMTTMSTPPDSPSSMTNMPMDSMSVDMVMTGVSKSTPLIQLNVLQSGDFQIPSSLAIINALSPKDASEYRRIVLSENMMGMEFYINGQLFDMNRVDFNPKLGTVEHWELVNETGMDHPMHLHVFPFQVYARNGIKNQALSLKDVVNVKAGETVDILIPFHHFEGRTVFHCHIVEHEDLGMMSIVEVKA